MCVNRLCVHFPRRTGLFAKRNEFVRAVDGVSFDLSEGETLGLVGESGSGKSTVGRAILRLVPVTSGQVRFEGRDLSTLSRSGLRALRRRMQIVFQDPTGSLNPRMKVGEIVGEPLLVHGIARGRALRNRVAELLERCGLPDDSMARAPHEFSGGQRQRIAIARALALEPKLVVCDEPTSALDVSVQAQILNLLRDLQKQFALTYLFISHDMAVVKHICDRVAVMRGGRIVEQGDCEGILSHPKHDYTRSLIESVLMPDPRARPPVGATDAGAAAFR